MSMFGAARPFAATRHLHHRHLSCDTTSIAAIYCDAEPTDATSSSCDAGPMGSASAYGSASSCGAEPVGLYTIDVSACGSASSSSSDAEPVGLVCAIVCIIDAGSCGASSRARCSNVCIHFRIDASDFLTACGASSSWTPQAAAKSSATKPSRQI